MPTESENWWSDQYSHLDRSLHPPQEQEAWSDLPQVTPELVKWQSQVQFPDSPYCDPVQWLLILPTTWRPQLFLNILNQVMGLLF